MSVLHVDTWNPDIPVFQERGVYVMCHTRHHSESCFRQVVDLCQLIVRPETNGASVD